MQQSIREKINMPEASLAEQIKRMELSEHLLADLKQQAKEEISQVQSQAEQAEPEPVPPASIESAIIALQQFQYMQNQLAGAITREIENKVRIEELEGICNERADLVKKQYAAATKITEARDHYKSECDKLLKKHNQEIDKANVTITRMQAQINASQKEVKELKALNPDRLQKQNKRLQSNNRELNEANTKLREQNNLNRKAGQALIDMKERCIKLEADNNRLHGALSEAVDDLNKANRPRSIQTVEDWQIYGSIESEDILIIRDPETGIERPYHRGTGVPKARAVPPSVLKQVALLFERMDQIRTHFSTDNEEAEVCDATVE